MRIKVCGITDLDQMHQLGELDVQFAGLIFYHKSPRFIMRHLSGYEVKKEKLKVYKIGVFVNASYDEVMNHVDNFGLDMVQLHGDETPYQCDKIANYISVIKVFRINGNEHVQWKIKDFYYTTDMFLFDSEGIGFGGTGKKFNWQILKDLNIGKPFLLGGGIEPEDINALKEFQKITAAKDLFAVDINSKFEIAPGIKDMTKIKKFVQGLNGNLINDGR